MVVAVAAQNYADCTEEPYGQLLASQLCQQQSLAALSADCSTGPQQPVRHMKETQEMPDRCALCSCNATSAPADVVA